MIGGLCGRWRRGASAGVWACGLCALADGVSAVVASARQPCSCRRRRGQRAAMRRGFGSSCSTARSSAPSASSRRVDDLVMLQVPLGRASDQRHARDAHGDHRRECRRLGTHRRLPGSPAAGAVRAGRRRARLRRVHRGSRGDAARRRGAARSARAHPAPRSGARPTGAMAGRASRLSRRRGRADAVGRRRPAQRHARGGRAAGVHAGAHHDAGAAAPAPPPPPLPPPTLQDVVAQALGLAPRVADAAERLLLLQSAEAMLVVVARSRPALGPIDASGRSAVRSRPRQTVTRKYERLRAWMLDKTTRLLAAADVRGLMRVREEVVSRDARLEAAAAGRGGIAAGHARHAPRARHAGTGCCSNDGPSVSRHSRRTPPS